MGTIHLAVRKASSRSENQGTSNQANHCASESVQQRGAFTVSARGFRCTHGPVVAKLPRGCAAGCRYWHFRENFLSRLRLGVLERGSAKMYGFPTVNPSAIGDGGSTSMRRCHRGHGSTPRPLRAREGIPDHTIIHAKETLPPGPDVNSASTILIHLWEHSWRAQGEYLSGGTGIAMVPEDPSDPMYEWQPVKFGNMPVGGRSPS